MIKNSLNFEGKKFQLQEKKVRVTRNKVRIAKKSIFFMECHGCHEMLISVAMNKCCTCILHERLTMLISVTETFVNLDGAQVDL